MIKAVLVFNNAGKVRLIKFFEHAGEEQRQQVLMRDMFKVLLRRTERMCNFVEWKADGGEGKIVYRQYATLFFVFWIDDAESALAILDLIQLYVEALDKCFESVCELDIIFHPDVCHAVLAECIQGGLVLETDAARLMAAHLEQNALVKQEDPLRAGMEAMWAQVKRRVTAQ